MRTSLHLHSNIATTHACDSYYDNGWNFKIMETLEVQYENISGCKFLVIKIIEPGKIAIYEKKITFQGLPSNH